MKQVTIPPSFKKAVSKGNIVDIFNKINTGRDQILGTMTLGDLNFHSFKSTGIIAEYKGYEYKLTLYIIGDFAKITG
jgi:hypothetical protein